MNIDGQLVNFLFVITPLLGFVLGIIGSTLIVRARLEKYKRINWLGMALLAVGIVLQLTLFFLQLLLWKHSG